MANSVATHEPWVTGTVYDFESYSKTYERVAGERDVLSAVWFWYIVLCVDMVSSITWLVPPCGIERGHMTQWV
jgi:hypothetical protein